MRLSKAGWLCLILTLAVACSDDNNGDKIPPAQTDGQDASQAQAAATRPRPQVIEVFNVGPTTYVRSLAIEAGSNRLWVGTSLGVNEIDLDSHALLNTFTRDHGLANEYVFGIGIDPDGYKWFGTNAGGMSRYKDGEWKTFFPMHGLADYWIYAFANDLDGGLWIGTWAGANYLDRQTQEFRTYVKELINEWVYGISVDSKGVVWFGTEGGVSRFDGETWTAWNHEDGLGGENPDALPFSRNTGLGTRSRHDLGILAGGKATYNPGYIFSILADHEDTIWAGTWGGGVTRYKNGAWTNLMEKDGLAGNIVYSIAQGPDGSYWFGTNKGLWNDVYAIAIEAGGNVWVGTLGGVSRLGMQPAAAQ
jgi:ligand-binding sensor domain-containing protein